MFSNEILKGFGIIEEEEINNFKEEMESKGINEEDLKFVLNTKSKLEYDSIIRMIEDNFTHDEIREYLEYFNNEENEYKDIEEYFN